MGREHPEFRDARSVRRSMIDGIIMRIRKVVTKIHQNLFLAHKFQTLTTLPLSGKASFISP